MSRVCTICGKRPVAGRTIARRGLAKKKGGVGKKITGVTKRRFLPNIQTVRAIQNGTARRIKVCAACIKAGKIKKA
ncbi:MAG: 50S ribosomal protein L28 [Candidatus Omnitrophica bacterium]|nr:50S ribosomal protein L28 [Candidatus Omnitrophota bacterium]